VAWARCAAPRTVKVDREVAIKVLPAALAQDPERLARFEREAKISGVAESSTGILLRRKREGLDSHRRRASARVPLSLAEAPARHAATLIAAISHHRLICHWLFSDVEQLDVEDQGRIWRNHTTGSASSVAELRRNSQLPFASNFHSRYSFVPAFDYLTASERK
jgi:hypothetical protein